MLHRIDAPLGNLAAFPLGARALEEIPIESAALARRVVRLASSAGDLGLFFGDGARLRDGDVVFADDARVIAVRVAADEVLVCRPATLAAAAALGHALGNRHIPMQADGDTIVVAPNAALEPLLASLGVPYERTTRILERPLLHAGTGHTHV